MRGNRRERRGGKGGRGMITFFLVRRHVVRFQLLTSTGGEGGRTAYGTQSELDRIACAERRRAEGEGGEGREREREESR